MEKESHEEENNSHTISGDFMAKRKRGRPRKHTKLEPNEQSPTGFIRSHQPRHRDDDEAMVGLAVTGVIEATFEAGYFLSVKVGNSDSVLRGVVFKPGHCDPVTVDNDVAPYVPMVGRKSEVVVQRHHGSANGGRKSRFREKRGGNNVGTPVPIQPALPTIPKNFVVPVNVNPQNGPVHHGPMQNETGSQASNGKPFETLLTQVMSDGQVHHHTAQSIEAESDEQALSIEPLQAIHPVHPVHVPKPMPSYGRGNMTELLQAVQENVRETHFSQGQ
jgi:hypothetical protein